MKIRGCQIAVDAWKVVKDTYEGRHDQQTRIHGHLTDLFINIMHLRYDDRKGSLEGHISTFELHWIKLVQAAEAGSSVDRSMAAGIVTFTRSDAWKASLLLGTLPRIQLYINIIKNITSGGDMPTYANVVLCLKELTTQSKQKKLTNSGVTWNDAEWWQSFLRE